MPYLTLDNKIISTPLWNIIMDVKNQLTNGKLRIVKRQGSKNIRLCCPHHNEGKELNPDCDIYIGETVYDSKGNIKVAYGTAKCFACEFKSDFVGFIAECFEISYEEAKNWLLDNYSDGVIEYMPELAPSIDIKSIGIKDSSSDLESIGGPFIEYKQYPSYCPYMEKRKITKEVAKEFEVKYNPKTDRLVFPVRDEYGKLVMFTQRSCKDKTFIIDAEQLKPVYLLYYIQQHNIKEVFICESQINALSLWSHGLPAVALFGTGAKHQYDILNKSNIRVYNLCFDGDAAGDKGIREFLKNIRKDVIVNILKVPRGKDINDLSYTEVETLVNTQLGI